MKMNKQIITTILGMILMITLVNAIDFKAGDTYTFESEEFDSYTVVGNSSSLEGLKVSWANGTTTIEFDIMFKPDSFTLAFWKEGEPVIEYHHSSSNSGGGSCLYDTNYDWECTGWSDECKDETQTRTCNLKNNCGNTYGKPDETKDCLVVEDDVVEDIEDDVEDDVEDDGVGGDEEPNNLAKIILTIALAILGIIILIYLIYVITRNKEDDEDDELASTEKIINGTK